MTLLLNYIKLCVFFNTMSTIIVILYNGKNNINNTINNFVSAFSAINFIKIINQLSFIKYIRRRQNFNNILKIDKIFDFLKFIFTIVAISFNKYLLINIFWIIFFIYFCCNCSIVIIEYLLNCVRPTLMYETGQPVINMVDNNINHNSVYVNIIENPNLVNYTVVKSNNITCAICIDEQKTNEKWIRLNCSHEYHQKCIFNWLQRDNTCPICRNNVN